MAAQFTPPAGFERWNRAMQGAYRKGAIAAMEGRSRSSCPYQDRRKWWGGLTWSQGFIKAWEDGWDANAPKTR